MQALQIWSTPIACHLGVIQYMVKLFSGFMFTGYTIQPLEPILMSTLKPLVWVAPNSKT